MSEIEIKGLIVQSAAKFFAKYGYRKTTMDEIAKQIHKAKGLLYYYFKNKESLFNEVLKQELQIVKDELIKITSSESNALDMIEKYLLSRFELLHKSVNYHETLRADFFENFHFVDDVRNDFLNFEKVQLTLIIDKGKSDGLTEMGNTLQTVELIHLVITSLEVPLFLQDKYEEYQQTINELIQFVINGLRKAQLI